MANSSPSVAQPALLSGSGSLVRWRPDSDVARRLTALALVVAAGAWLGFYITTPLPFIEVSVFRATVLFHLVTAAVLVPYLVLLIAQRRLPGGSALDVPVAVFVVASLLATAASLDWRISLEATLTGFMAAGVFYALSGGVLRSWQVELALMLAIATAALKALWIDGNDYLDWLRLANAVNDGWSLSSLIPPTVPKIHGVGDHPNILGGAFAMSLPFFMIGVLRANHVALRTLSALGALALLLATWLTLARSAWMAAVAGAVVTCVLLIICTEGGRELRERARRTISQRRWLFAVSAAAMLFVALVGVLYVARSVEARPEWLFRDSGTPRQDVMEAGVEMWADHPITGIGPAVYGQLYPEYSGLYPNHAFHAHNGYLQGVIDLGVPGAITMLALIAALGWLLWRGLRMTSGAARLSVIACAGSLASFAVFSLFDTPNGSKSIIVPLAAVGAVLVLAAGEYAPAMAPVPPRFERALKTGARIAVPAALVGMIALWGWLDIGHYAYSNSVGHANARRWPQAIAEAERAVDLDPSAVAYRLSLGTIRGRAYLATGDEAHLPEAIVQLDRAAELEPRSAIAHANLALLFADSGDRDRARAEALAAVRFANSDEAVVLVAATSLERTGWEEDALDAYAVAVSLDPALVNSRFWSESTFRSKHLADVVGRSPLAYNACERLWLATPDAPPGPLHRATAFEGCAAYVQAHPGHLYGRAALAEALIEDGRYAEARAHLDYALVRQPDNGPGRTALGSWYAARGNVEAAREQWLRAGGLNEVEALVRLGDSYPAGQVPESVMWQLGAATQRSASEVQVHLAGILYYRIKFYRASPATVLLPGEWQRAVPAEYARGIAALTRWRAAANGP